MNIRKLEKAIDEAKRFIERAEALKFKFIEDPLSQFVCGLPKERGACRRASMELTRSLSELRNPECS